MNLKKWKGIYESICWDRALVLWKKDLPYRGLTKFEKHWSRAAHIRSLRPEIRLGNIVYKLIRLCGLVVRVSGYGYRGPGFDSPPLPDFLSNSGSGTGSAQPREPREVNWGATWMKKVAAPGIENRD